MADKAASAVLKTMNLSWLTGPIFDKELRVSSRRRRNYVLRAAYLAILLFLVITIWANEVDVRNNSAVYRMSRLSRAGLNITMLVVGFQFYAAQVIAVIMLSNSISDEIYNKTLGVLMSTPITSVQIILGKLLSKLLQISLLLCFTLPILGIVRVFGGVPWDFLVSTFCVTVTAVLFAAMVSINLSIQHKHAYAVIISSIFTLFGLYVLLPLFVGWATIEWFDLVNDQTFMKWLCLFNPVFVMQAMIEELMRPGGTGITFIGWWVNCLIMLAGSLILFVRASIVVRKKALLQACGQAVVPRKKRKDGRSVETNSKIRRVRGNPLLWKELQIPMFKATRLKKIMMFLLVFGCLLIGYYISAKEHVLDNDYSHIMYSIMFMIIGVFFNTVIAATTITSERHSQNWPLLLCTLLTDWSILRAKLIGVFRRVLLAWSLLFTHIIIFIFVGYIHPSVLLHALIIVLPVIFLITSSGIFFSTLLKRTTSAVIANIVFVAFIWAGVIFLGVLVDELTGSHDVAEATLSWNPFYHISQIMDVAAGDNNASMAFSQFRYRWEFMDETHFMGTTLMLCGAGILNISVGVILLVIAKANFRKRIFR